MMFLSLVSLLVIDAVLAGPRGGNNEIFPFFVFVKGDVTLSLTSVCVSYAKLSSFCTFRTPVGLWEVQKSQ